MAESRVLSQKSKEKAESSRAVWSDNQKKVFLDLCIQEVLSGGRPGTNLKSQSWKRVIDGFKEKTGILYGQKQLKNQWDLMRKQYNAWVTLCGQTGIGYNEVTHTVTMEPERWDEYLKGHPDAKIFKTRPLSFSDEMKILFSRTQARGEDTWTPSSGSFPEDLNNDRSSPSPNLVNTQVMAPLKTPEERGEEELMANVRRKRPRLSQSRKEAKNKKFDDSFERLVIALEADKNQEREEKIRELKEKIRELEEKNRELEEKNREREEKGPTIAECVACLKQISNIGRTSRLFIFALTIFRVKENRELWMSIDDNDVRIEVLKTLMEKES
eukprot:TRINITY_DN4696_c1_g1_i10.p1 TRINITY_DN4696_c1_g1~~TRINITY_DN4696_c1_g1_i10.p1  ORF type:complete len:328 (-),score=51.94 TRINITY_DN4696_c1_g1_i10:166-1149(-)